MQKRVFASLAALSLSLSACGGAIQPMVSGAGLSGINSFGRAPAKRAGEKAWTIMVHLAADNNLYKFGLEDLNEAEAGMNSDDVNIIVLFDGTPKGDSAIYKVKKDPAGKNTTIISDKVDDAGAVIPASKEIDSGDLKTNLAFTKFAISKFPAQNYAQFYWDHGSGIFGKGRKIVTKGFNWDDSGSHMKTADLTTLASTAAQAAGKPVELIGFDACLMAHAEIAYQAKGLANNLVASQELEPGAGWDYQGWVGGLSKNPTANGAQLGKIMVDAYVASYKPGGSQNPGGRAVDVTLSNTDINATANKLTPALNKLAAAMTAGYAANKAVLDDIRKKTVTMDNTDCADLGDFLSNGLTAGLPAELTASFAQAHAAYKATVTANGNGGSPTHLKASGLNIYFPRPDQAYNPVYGNPSNIAYGAENWKDYLVATHKTARR